MPRLFVALRLPDPVKRSLEPLARGLGDVRWLAPEQQHLTLRFIGERRQRPRWTRSPRRWRWSRAPPFELGLEGLGHFPPRGEPQVLWVGVAKNPELAGLKRRIDRALAAVGTAARGAQVRAARHLARMRGAALAERLATYLMRHSLYRSETLPGQRLPSLLELAQARWRRVPDRGELRAGAGPRRRAGLSWSAAGVEVILGL